MVAEHLGRRVEGDVGTWPIWEVNRWVAYFQLKAELEAEYLESRQREWDQKHPNGR